jgi:hypothetical protein
MYPYNYNNTFIIVRNSEETYVSTYDDSIDMDKFFYEVSKRIAFSDCADETVLFICWRGHEIEYFGWQPNMRYEFIDLNDCKVIWVGDFPEWDH